MFAPTALHLRAVVASDVFPGQDLSQARVTDEASYAAIEGIRYDGSKSVDGYFVDQPARWIAMLMVYKRTIRTRLLRGDARSAPCSISGNGGP